MPGKKKYRFEVQILDDYCKGCRLCVEFCPNGKLAINDKPNKVGIQQAYVRPVGECSGCLKCALICPDAAIEVFRTLEKEEAGAKRPL